MISVGVQEGRGAGAQLLLQLTDQMRSRSEVSGHSERQRDRGHGERGGGSDPAAQAHDSRST
jgi:hypothetical protein